MDDPLFEYFERELTFLRGMGAEYARKYPTVAGRLQLEADHSPDPHTERLIEAFAFLAGRIHKKLDDDFPEITESLFQIIYPHYVRPIPSMTIVEFVPLVKNLTPSGYTIPAGTPLFRQHGQERCQFETRQPVDLWPVSVAEAEYRDPPRPVAGAMGALRLQLRTHNKTPFSKLGWKSLRIFLNGQPQQVYPLYEFLLNRVRRIEWESGNAKGVLREDAVRPVGFEPGEAMLPQPRRSFPGYRLLNEYFTFPERFRFLDLTGLDGLKGRDAGETLDLWVYLDRAAGANQVVGPENFRLHAAPAVNLFRRIAEPIRVSRERTEYPLIPDIRRPNATEIFSVDRVTATAENRLDETMDYRPFYSVRHHLEGDNARGAYWHQTRRPSGRAHDNGTDVFLSFTDLELAPADPGVDVVTVHCTCTNRDLPARLPWGRGRSDAPSLGTSAEGEDAEEKKAAVHSDFTMELAAPVAGIQTVIRPTPTRRPGLSGALQWRLVSHLSLNYMSVVEEGTDAFREMLRVYDFDQSPSTRQQIDGIARIDSRHVTRRLGNAFVRGVEVTLTLDEDKFVGSGLFLFASMLERFLAQYVSVNAFVQTVLRTVGREGIRKRWPPRSGTQVLV